MVRRACRCRAGTCFTQFRGCQEAVSRARKDFRALTPAMRDVHLEIVVLGRPAPAASALIFRGDETVVDSDSGVESNDAGVKGSDSGEVEVFCDSDAVYDSDAVKGSDSGEVEVFCDTSADSDICPTRPAQVGPSFARGSICAS